MDRAAAFHVELPEGQRRRRSSPLTLHSTSAVRLIGLAAVRHSDQPVVVGVEHHHPREHRLPARPSTRLLPAGESRCVARYASAAAIVAAIAVESAPPAPLSFAPSNWAYSLLIPFEAGLGAVRALELASRLTAFAAVVTATVLAPPIVPKRDRQERRHDVGLGAEAGMGLPVADRPRTARRRTGRQVTVTSTSERQPIRWHPSRSYGTTRCCTPLCSDRARPRVAAVFV